MGPDQWGALILLVACLVGALLAVGLSRSAGRRAPEPETPTCRWCGKRPVVPGEQSCGWCVVDGSLR